MPQSDDITLLKQYARGDESAFTVFVERYIHLVYSTALRQVGNPSHAEEITQAVFIILTRKAGSISSKTILSGWLYQTARLTAANFLRSEIRRQRRDQEAYMQSTLTEPDVATWEQIAPLLDEAMGRLGQADRNAIVLRFFENKTPQEVATTLKLNEATARKRVSRALEKLRRFFSKRGVSSTTAVIAGAISVNSVHAAPVALAKSVTAVALTRGATASASTLTLIKGALKVMVWIKTKTAIIAGVVVLLAAGTTTVTIEEIQVHRTYPWQTDHPSPQTLDHASPQVRILPAKYNLHRGPEMNVGLHGVSYKNDFGKMFGLSQSVQSVVQAAYSFGDSARFVFPTNLLANLSYNDYDFIASQPQGNAEALQQEVKRRFGVVAKPETRETDVLLLEVKFPNAPGLRHSMNPGGRKFSRRGQHFTFINTPLSDFATNYIEPLFEIPVVDRTGLTGGFDIDLDVKMADSNTQSELREIFKQALLDQLGLELVPSREPIEMLVVEKAQ